MAMDKNAFQKSLARLEQMAKSQLFHTSSNSEPSSWAGTTPTQESEDDSIDENGTDINSVKKSLETRVAKGYKPTDAETAILKGENPLKLIADKVSKGVSLTKAETWALKGGMGMFGQQAVPPMTKATTEDMKKEEGEVGEGNASAARSASQATKSLEDAVKTSPAIQKGISMSPFLLELVKGMGAALEGVEARVAEKVAKSLAPVIARIETFEKSFASYVDNTAEYRKSLAETVVGIAHQGTAQAEIAAANATAPARAPRSQMRAGTGTPGQVAPVQKSFGPGGFDNSIESLNKSQIANVMADMVKGGKLAPMEVLKFESSGRLDEGTQRAVLAHLSNGR